MPQNTSKKPIYAFVDASNLFYGGKTSLGWKIDYKKLLNYLKEKYAVRKCFYYGGIETFGFNYSILNKKPIDLKTLKRYLLGKIKEPKLSTGQVVLIDRSLKTINFYLHLDQFGFHLQLKPVKVFTDENGKQTKKANC